MSLDGYNKSISAFRAIGAKALRYRPFKYPSQWFAEQCWLDGASAGTGTDQRFDIWQYPCNVGIVDSRLEGKRGLYVMKGVQVAVSHYLQNLALYEVAYFGGPVAYSMAKDETARKHVLDRIDVNLRRGEDMVELFLPDRKDHSTIKEKRFANGSLTFFGSASVNNFKSNSYRAFFADEFELMDSFKDGSDVSALAMGRQSSFEFPFFYGWSSPLEEDAKHSIAKYIDEQTDKRLFYIRCPHCSEPFNMDFFLHVHFENDEDTGLPMPHTAELRCPACSHPISDSERAGALIYAAKSRCKWFDEVPEDPEVGWISTMSPEDAANREFAGFSGLNHLHMPHKKVRDIVSKYAMAKRSEGKLKTFYNDDLGLPYTILGQRASADDVKALKANDSHRTLPPNTLFCTMGSDVQGGGEDKKKLTFYYEIAAWSKTPYGIKKHTLVIDRMTSTHRDGFKSIKEFAKGWTWKTRQGHDKKLDMVVIDAGWQSKYVYPICNTLSGHGGQWAVPTIFTSKKPGEPDYRLEAQNDRNGDPAKAVLLTNRDYIVQRVMDRILDGKLIELPNPLPDEVVRHYTVNEMQEHYDSHGNFLGMHWKKRIKQNGFKEQDDFFMAACYGELAAILLGIDRQEEALVAESHRDAEEFATERRRRESRMSSSRSSRVHRLRNRH